MMHVLSTVFFTSILIGCICHIGKTVAQSKREYEEMTDEEDRLGRDDH